MPVALVGLVTIGLITIFLAAHRPGSNHRGLAHPDATGLRGGGPPCRRTGASERARGASASPRDGSFGLIAVLTVAWVALGIVTMRLNPGVARPRIGHRYPLPRGVAVGGAGGLRVRPMGDRVRDAQPDLRPAVAAVRLARHPGRGMARVARSSTAGARIDPMATGPTLSAPMVGAGCGRRRRQPGPPSDEDQGVLHRSPAGSGPMGPATCSPVRPGRA